jgi:predicted metal-dependent hydrolase
MLCRWGSCTPANVLVLNPEAIRLPYSLIDYLIVHELCHTKVKDHSAAFWSEVARHLPDWQERDERVKTFGG